MLLLTGSFALAQDYSGPSILSRGGARPGQRGGEPISFIYYMGVGASYTSGDIPLVDENGKAHTVSAYGIQANFGLTGSHRWRRSMFGLDYRGNYRYDTHGSFGSGSDQAISMAYHTRLSRRVQVSVAETGTVSSFAFGGYTSTAFATSDLIGVPLNDIFDSRVYGSQTTGILQYRQSSHLQLAGMMDGFFIRRANKNLIGVNGYRGTGIASYALDRRSSLSVDYSFTHFDFPRAFGASDIHGVALSYQRAFGRSWRATVSLGGYRVETLGTQSVSLSAEVASLLGVSTGIEAVYRVSYSPSMQASATYGRRRSNFTIGYVRGVTPGNGVYLTSNLQSVNMGYSYSGLRRASLSVNGGYTRYGSLYQNIGNYGSYQAGLSSSFKIYGRVSGSAQFDVRRFAIVNGGSHLGTSANLSLVWSPSRLPLPAW
jgi:hypothetical protein